MRKVIVLIFVSFLFFSCATPESEAYYEYKETSCSYGLIHGYIQKGPFMKDAEIIVEGLNYNSNGVGSLVYHSTLNDTGYFYLGSSFESDYLEIIATGTYYNEVTDQTGDGPISLSIISPPGSIEYSDNTDDTVNINVLTTLSRKRIKYLIVNNGSGFLTAKKQSELEILKIFKISDADILQVDGFEKMYINKPGNNNAILLAISVILQEGNSPPELTELLAKISSDIEEDGTLDKTRYIDELHNNAMSVDKTAVRNNLTAYYSSIGETVIIPQFEDFIDSDGSGKVDKDD